MKALVLVLGALAVPAGASGADTHLTLSQARSAAQRIVSGLQKPGVTVRLGNCRRLSSKRASCALVVHATPSPCSGSVTVVKTGLRVSASGRYRCGRGSS